jgi:hypothetical protein
MGKKRNVNVSIVEMCMGDTILFVYIELYIYIWMLYKASQVLLLAR